MIKIEIKEALKNRKEVTRNRDGKIFVLYEQPAYAFTYNEAGQLNAYPEAIKIPLDDNQPPFAPGMYTISPVSIYKDRFGNLALSRVKLLPFAASKAA